MLVQPKANRIAARVSPAGLGICLYLFVALLLPAPAAAAGVFDNLAGKWSGSGTIELKDGSKERIRCNATYNVTSGTSVNLEITCASASYKFQLQSSIVAAGNSLSGNWTESSRRVAGQIEGSVNGDRIRARAAGQTFTALVSLTTRGSRQTVSIASPGSEMTEIRISLGRR
jgi:hypothetical protein